MKLVLLFLVVGFLYPSDADTKKNARAATQNLNKAENTSSSSDDTPDSKQQLIDQLTRIRDDYLQKSKEFPSPLPNFSPDQWLRLYDKNDSIPNLRGILSVLGYFKASDRSPIDSSYFDIQLDSAVRAFQTDHCLESTGITSTATQDRLNWSYEKRANLITQTIGEIQKLTFTDKTVIANIPTYCLSAFGKGRVYMKIIVGRVERQTPEMTSYIDGIEFNPAWIVPPTIFFEDKLPKIQHDVGKFFEKNPDFHLINIADNNRKVKDPSKIDWNTYSIGNCPYLLRQDPGEKNALGLYKFNLKNDQLIYMHDTTRRDLFEKKSSRALSSGCIRLEKPEEFAKWLLDKDDLEEYFEDEDTKTQPIKPQATVYITYLPVWLNDQGKILWGDDPYKKQ